LKYPFWVPDFEIPVLGPSRLKYPFWVLVFEIPVLGPSRLKYPFVALCQAFTFLLS